MLCELIRQGIFGSLQLVFAFFQKDKERKREEISFRFLDNSYLRESLKKIKFGWMNIYPKGILTTSLEFLNLLYYHYINIISHSEVGIKKK